MSDVALLRCDGCGVRRRVFFDTDGMGNLVERAAACKCTPVITRAETIRIMPKPLIDKAVRDQIREFVSTRRAADPTLKAPQLIEEVRERFYVAMTSQNFYQTYWVSAAIAPSGSGAVSIPPEELATNHFELPAGTAETITPEELGAREQAQIDEIRSLRATYEGDPFLRVEEEDGEWRLIANLPFGNRAEAFRAAAALSGALDG